MYVCVVELTCLTHLEQRVFVCFTFENPYPTELSSTHGTNGGLPTENWARLFMISTSSSLTALERVITKTYGPTILQWRHNERNDISNHRRLHCLLNRLFRRRSKKTSKLRVTGLCAGEFPEQRASSAENASIWWRHHEWWHCWHHDDSGRLVSHWLWSNKTVC